MTDTLKLALAQLNPTVGNIDANLALALDAHAKAAKLKADAVILSELFLVGYPPEDLVLKPAFQNDAMAALGELAKATTAQGAPAIIVGTPWREDGKLYNGVALLADGRIEALVRKVHLPNYGVFDELRVFSAGSPPGPVSFKGVRLGLMVCEDIWTEDVAECLGETGAEILIVVNGSPFSVDKFDVRMQHALNRRAETGLPIVYVNQVGGQDELVFDGASFVVNGDGKLACQLPAWESRVTLSEWRREASGWRCARGELAVREEGTEAVYLAALLGLRDYVDKNRFPGVVIGLSGGVDSAVTAAIAVDALGADRVHCVMMPYKYTASDSLEDAAACAKSLGTRYSVMPIEPAVSAFTAILAEAFMGTTPDTAEENIQSRVRGLVLMALSNKFGNMVITTGNKSEMSVGYATLYGDMCGGFNPLKDIYKTQVFELACWRNAAKPKLALGPAGNVIPQRIIDKPPSAELRPNQKDEDSLPPYRVLDDILASLVEGEMGFDDVVARGHDPAVVKRVEHLLYVAEYKRRQAPPGVKVSVKNFGRDRRYPLTNGYRDALTPPRSRGGAKDHA